MNTIFNLPSKNDVKEVAMDFAEWAFDQAINLITLFVGALLVGASIVATFMLVSQARANPEAVSLLSGSFQIAGIMTMFVIGVRIMKQSDYADRLFRRW